MDLYLPPKPAIILPRRQELVRTKAHIAKPWNAMLMGGLGVTALGGAGGTPLPPATIAFASNNHTTSNPFTSVSRNSQNFGTETPSRQMLLLGFAQRVGSTSVFTGCTIGGVAATEIGKTWGAGNATGFSAYITPRTDAGGVTGTSGNITTTHGANMSRAAWVVFAVNGLVNQAAAFDVETHTANPGAATVSYDTGASGVVAAMAVSSETGVTNWTGIDTEVCDLTYDVSNLGRYAGALVAATNAATGVSMSAINATTGVNYIFTVSLR